MEREEAIKILRAIYNNALFSVRNALETLIPELTESEDDRIRKEIISALKFANDGGVYDKHISYLEKQKEQPQEELVCRMNGLMQEYIKEGKDEAEKEHRFKCYQLFWDALEDADFFEQKEQKPAEWSEEDKDYYDAIIVKLEVTQDDALLTDNQIDFLKSLPERFNLQPKQEWSEDDKDKITFLERLIRYNVPEGQYGWPDGHKGGFITKLEAIAMLKSLCPQPKAEWSDKEKGILLECISVLQSNSHWLLADELKSLRPQPKQKWSEEDEKKLGKCIDAVSGYYSPEDKQELKNWLKSLLHRFSLSSWGEEIQTAFFGKVNKEAWRPSEEQMDRLFSIVTALRKDYCDDMADFLASLYKQLKKL